MSMPNRVVSCLPVGTAFSRYVMTLGAARGDAMSAIVIAERFKDSPQISATLDLQAKAAVSAGTTTDATFAGPLATYGVAGEALALLRGTSILGALENKFRRVPFRTTVPRETGTGTGGAWVGEGLITPVAATAYGTLSQEVYKAQKIVVLSRELLKLGDPSAERTVRETVTAGVGAFIDSQMLTSTITLSAGVRPAAITNGATRITSTGTTAAPINSDLALMLGAISTSGAALTWVMRPLTAARIASAGGAAAADLPRTLFGLPVVISANSPQQITLIDAAHVLYSDEGGIDISTSEQAAIIMDSDPDAVVQANAAAAVHRSLFQDNLWGVRVTRWLAYLRAETGAVAFMTVTY